MPSFQLADRLAAVPPYLFAEIDRVKNEVKARGVDIISLGIGDPDTPTPDFIIQAMTEALRKPEHHQYPSYVGMLAFRKSVADWYQRRFGVALDPENEVVSLIGSKEGLAHFPLAFVNPGDLVLACSPCYPVYPIATAFAGGQTHSLPLTAANDFLPDLDSIDAATWQRAKILFLNFPGNPTAAMAPRDFFAKCVELCHRHEVILVHDAAYTEIYYDPADKPLSILEIDGAKDVAIEFHSLSKTFNMTGWRIGMAVGNPQLVKGLGKIKENVDSGIFQAVQEAGIVALEQGDAFTEGLRTMYKARRDVVVSALQGMGVEFQVPKAAFYVWARIPKGYDSSAAFVTKVLQETGVVVTPGNGFGAAGEGYFRITLTVDEERLKEAMARIAAL